MGGLWNALGSLFDPSKAFDPAADQNLQSRIVQATPNAIKAGLNALSLSNLLGGVPPTQQVEQPGPVVSPTSTLGRVGQALQPENYGMAGALTGMMGGALSGEPESPPMIRSVGDLMDNPLQLKGKGLTHDLGAALDQTLQGNQLPPIGKGTDIDPHRARALEQMHQDVQYGLQNLAESRGWYTTDVAGMEKQLAESHPEFQQPANRSLFKYLLAITSNGVDPETNFGATMKGWDMFRRDGAFSAYDPTQQSPFGNPKGLGLTFRANSYEGAIGRLNQLIQDKGGIPQAVDWLQAEHPVRELRQYYKDVPGKASDQRYGSYIFGEKVGSFGANLNGIHTELTADKWWSRTWNRWMGTVMATDAAGNPMLHPETGQPLLQDTPRNATERNLMRETASKVAGDLGLNVDELQAVLWYTEQALYRAHGLEAGSIGYDEAARNYFTKRAGAGGAEPLPENAGNRPPPAGGGANAQPRAAQRGAPKAPKRLPRTSPASSPEGLARGGLHLPLGGMYDRMRSNMLDSLKK